MAGNAVYRITVKDDGTAVVKKFNNNITKSGKTADQASSSFSKLGETIKNAFVMGVVYKSLGKFNQMVGESIQAILGFDLALNKISGITGKTGKDLEDLSATARNVAMATEHSADAVLNVALLYTKAGRSIKETNEMTAITMDLVTASSEDATTVMELLNGTMNAFGANASEASHYANVLQSTVSGSAMGISDLAEAMKFAAPFANQLGVSVEETASILGKFADAGLKGSIGGNSLKNIMVNLIKTTKTGSKFLKGINIEGKDLIDIIKELSDKTDITEFTNIFNLRGLTGANILAIKEMDKEVKTFTSNLINESTKVEDVADQIRNAWSVGFTDIGTSFSSVLIEFSEAWKKNSDLDSTPVTTLVEYFTDLQERIKETPEDFEGMFKALDTFISLADTATKFILLMVDGFISLTKAYDDKLWVRLGVNIIAVTGGVKLLGKAIISTNGALMINPYAALITAGLAFIGHIDNVGKKIKDSAEKWNDIYTSLSNAPRESFNKALEEQINKLEEYENVFGGGIDTNITYLTNKIALHGKLSKKLQKQSNSKNIVKNAKKQLKEQLELASITESTAKKMFNTEMSGLGVEWSEMSQLFKNASGNHETGFDNILEQIGIDIDVSRVRMRDWAKILTEQKMKILEAVKLDDPKKKKTNDLKINTSGDKEGSSRAKAVEVVNVAMFEGIQLSKELTNALDKSFSISRFDDYEKAFTSKAVDPMEALNDNLKKIDKEQDKNIKNISKFGVEAYDAFANLQTAFDLDDYTRGVDSLDTAMQNLLSTLSNRGALDEETFLKIKSLFKAKDIELSNQALQEYMSNISNMSSPRFEGDFFARQDTFKEAKNKFKNYGKEINELLNSGEFNDREKKNYWDDYLELKEETLSNKFFENADAIIEVSQSLSNSLTDIFNVSFDRRKAQYDEEMSLIDKKYQLEMSLAGDNAKRQALLMQDKMRAEKKAALELQKAEDRHKKRQKAIMVGEGIVNALSASIAMMRDSRSLSTALRIAQGAAVFASGMATVAKIKNTRLSGGGPVRGNGQSFNSDKIPALLSENEYVINSQAVQSIGGIGNVEDMINTTMMNQESGGGRGGQTIIIQNSIGEPEFVRGIYQQIYEEGIRWR